MSLQGLVASNLKMRLYSDIELKKMVNPLYNYMLLQKYVDTIIDTSQGIKNRKDEFFRYIDQFQKESEIPTNTLNDSIGDETEIKKISNNLLKAYRDDSDKTSKYYNQNIIDMDKETFKTDTAEVLKYILLNKFKRYDFFEYLQNKDKLFVFLDIYNSDSVTLGDYISNKRKELSYNFRSSVYVLGKVSTEDTQQINRLIPGIDKEPYTSFESIINGEHEKGDNVFFLKVLVKNNITNNEYREIVKDEFKRLDDYLRSKFINDSSTNKNTPYKEVIFFCDDTKEAELSYKIFNQTVIKTKFFTIFNEEFKKYMINSRGNINSGIQNKRVNKNIIKNTFYNLSFYELNRETNIIKEIKDKYNTRKKDGQTKDESNTTTIQILTRVYFSHYMMGEMYKEFFDKKYLKNKLSSKTTESKNNFIIYYKYIINKPDNVYQIPKVVSARNYLYDLEITGLDNITITGYFKTKGKYYNYNITEINIDTDNLFTKLFTQLCFKKLKEEEQGRKIRDNTYKLKTFIQFLFTGNNSQFKNKSNSVLIKVNEEGDNNKYGSLRDFLTYYYNNDSENHLNDDDVKNVYKSLKTIINENLEYDLDILYLLLNIKSITLNITKKNSLHNFKLLEKKNKGKYYDERNIGLLKKHIPKHYYEEFTLNRIDPKLPDHKQIIFYDDLLITKDSLISYLKEKKMYTKNINLSSTLLSILDNLNLLDELFIHTNENFKNNILKNVDDNDEQLRFKEKIINNIIDIIFESSTPFYVSKMKTEDVKGNKGTIKNYNTSYLINNIEKKTVLLKYATKELLESIVTPFDFYGKEKMNKKSFFNAYDINTNNDSKYDKSINHESLRYIQRKKKEIEKYIDYDSFIEKFIQDNSTRKGNVEIKPNPYAVVEISLLPTSDFKHVNNCKTRKKRISGKIMNYVNKKLQNVDLFTRKMKNKLKNNRLQTRKRLTVS